MHAQGGVFGGLDGAAGGDAAETGDLAGGVVDTQADERVAAAQVVVEEGEGAPTVKLCSQSETLASSTVSGFLSTP